jgi:hypothetical protein
VVQSYPGAGEVIVGVRMDVIFAVLINSYTDRMEATMTAWLKAILAQVGCVMAVGLNLFTCTNPHTCMACSLCAAHQKQDRGNHDGMVQSYPGAGGLLRACAFMFVCDVASDTTDTDRIR